MRLFKVTKNISLFVLEVQQAGIFTVEAFNNFDNILKYDYDVTKRMKICKN